MALMLSLAFLFLVSCEKKLTPLPEIGNQAPSFTLKDLKGKKVRLKDFQGKVVVIDFWATWCHACKFSSQELQKLHEKYKDSEVVIVGISMDLGSSAVETVRNFMKRLNLTYSMLMDDGEASRNYAVIQIPVTYILDKNHVIVQKYPGYVPGLGEMISNEIENLL
jgi:peroxiredoxin